MSQIGKSFVVARWMVACTAGIVVGIGAALALGRPIEALVGMMLVTPILTLLVGASLGTSQWLELRRVLRHAAYWVPATCVGLGVGLAAGVVAVEQIGTLLIGHRPHLLGLGVGPRTLSLMAVGAIAGLCLGLAQGLVLRRQAPWVKAWAGRSAAALGAAFGLASLAVAAAGGLGSPRGFVVFVTVAGLLLGAGTARPLLVRAPAP
jgi:hypothetical protein